jgi:hypothetical protein
LTAFLNAAGDPRRSIWHLDDCTPAMSPTALALIRLCDPMPPSIARFCAGRQKGQGKPFPVHLPRERHH